MFQPLTLIKFPAPPGSRFPGIKMMSLDLHFGHCFVFFIQLLRCSKRAQHILQLQKLLLADASSVPRFGIRRPQMSAQDIPASRRRLIN
jgi:hypothetical protein